MHGLTVGGGALVAGAGFLAGAINAIVGSGSLITFPTLVGLGLSPLVANVSNNVGIMVGSASGTFGYRRELRGQGSRIRALGPWSFAGGLAGSVLLLARPGAFHAVVPWLVLFAVALVIVQPFMARRLATSTGERHSGGLVLRLFVLAVGVYGGYFGAAQGVMLVALLVIGVGDGLQRMTGLKNALAFLVNGVAAVVFVIAAPIDWVPAVIIAFASAMGAQVGARYGRRLPDAVLRAVIVVGGIAVVIKLLV